MKPWLPYKSIEKSFTEARKWFKMAADQNDAQSGFALIQKAADGGDADTKA